MAIAPIHSASAPAATTTTQTSAWNALAATPTKKIVISRKRAPRARRCDGARIGARVYVRALTSSVVRTAVLAVARAVRSLAVGASAAALVIAVVLYSDGVSAGEILAVVLAVVPPIVLWILWAALRELAELPDRLRRMPETARERRVDVERITGELRSGGGVMRVPRVLWRLRVLAGAARDLATPHAPLLPFLSATFLTWSAIAAFAAVAEIGIALLLLISTVL
jgi:hypothetical protein